MSPTTIKRLTYADYARIPEDGRRHEIIEGEWYMTPAPDAEHQRVSRRLSRCLDGFVTEHGLGEVFYAPFDVLLSDTDVVQPDILFISAGRSAIVTAKNVQGSPDLVIEILSASTAAIDRIRKLTLYEKSGIREYWIVDPAARSVEIHEFASPRRTRVYDGAQAFESALLPGLTIRLSDIF